MKPEEYTEIGKTILKDFNKQHRYKIAREVVLEWMKATTTGTDFHDWLDQQQAEPVVVHKSPRAERGVYPSKVFVPGIAGGKWYVPEEQQAEEECEDCGRFKCPYWIEYNTANPYQIAREVIREYIGHDPYLHNLIRTPAITRWLDQQQAEEEE